MSEAPKEVTCAHCDLPVPAELIQAESGLQFCCGGCRAVYAILHEHGLDGTFYQLLDDDDKRQAKVTDRSYREFDDEAFAELYVRADGGVQTVELYLEAVHCTACVWLVERLPTLLYGVQETRLDLGRQLATVSWDPNTVELSAIARKLDSLGYPVHPFRGVDRRQLRRDEDRRLLIRIAVAGAVAGNVMLMAAALYAGLFGDMSAEHRSFLRWVSLLITLPSVLWCGAVFYRGAIGALRVGSLHMDLPISVGIASGFIWGAVNTVRGGGEVYFDSVTVLIFLLLVGRWLQQRQQRGAADAAEMLYSLTPTSVRVVTGAVDGAVGGGEIREVPVETVTEGTLIEVRAGETIPTDGVVAHGHSTLNASLLSGESKPLPVREGDEVHAGTVNLGALLRIEVNATGEATRVGQLMKRIEEHARRRAPIVQLADRISGYFVGTTLGLAALTALLWSWLDTPRAVEHAVALLIVTCPCALGLATPLAVSVAIGRAARRGILIKGGDVVERLARPGRVLLDKTGTLTEGQQTLISWTGDARARELAVALERQSAHPLALALLRAEGGEADEAALAVADVEETLGGGIAGVVEGERVLVGSPRFVAEALETELQGALASAVDAAVEQAQTPIAVAVDGVIVAVAAFGDPLRADAPALIAELRRLGFIPEILSGDHPRVVEAVARQLDIAIEHAEGSATPERKLERVRAASEEGPVVMVGDGVNDAAALSAATCGVAVHGSAEASLTAADVFMSQPGLHPVIALLHGAQTTLHVIRSNILFSLGYNAIGASLAIAGVISPLIAALLMPLSSLTVVTNSFRRRTFGDPR